MSLGDAIDSWPAAAGLTLLLDGAVALVPYTAGEVEPPAEYIDFELVEPVSLPPEPEPEPPEPEPEPPGPENPDPEADPTITSAESNQPDDATPDEVVELRTGIALDDTQLVDEGMAVRVGNTSTPGFDADVAPGDLKGFQGGGAGGGSTARILPDVPPELLRAFQPPYPKHLVATGIEGRVKLLVEVLPNGRAGEVTVVQGIHPELDQLAVVSMKRFRWRPARRDGERVATTIPLVFRFTIRD